MPATTWRDDWHWDLLGQVIFNEGRSSKARSTKTHSIDNIQIPFKHCCATLVRPRSYRVIKNAWALSILHLRKTLLPEQHYWELLVQIILVQAWIIYQPLSWEVQYYACMYSHSNKCDFMVSHPTPSVFSVILSRCTSLSLRPRGVLLS